MVQASLSQSHQLEESDCIVRAPLTAALVSFHQQILTPFSDLPLAISHQTVLILQHYLDVSPTTDEIFAAWKAADEVGVLM